MAGRLAIADMEDKDALIQELREELTSLERQVDEFNEIRLSIVKVSGKNIVRKLKTTVLTPRSVECTYYWRNVTHCAMASH